MSSSSSLTPSIKLSADAPIELQMTDGAAPRQLTNSACLIALQERTRSVFLQNLASNALYLQALRNAGINANTDASLHVERTFNRDGKRRVFLLIRTTEPVVKEVYLEASEEEHEVVWEGAQAELYAHLNGYLTQVNNIWNQHSTQTCHCFHPAEHAAAPPENQPGVPDARAFPLPVDPNDEIANARNNLRQTGRRLNGRTFADDQVVAVQIDASLDRRSAPRVTRPSVAAPHRPQTTNPTQSSSTTTSSSQSRAAAAVAALLASHAAPQLPNPNPSVVPPALANVEADPVVNIPDAPPLDAPQQDAQAAPVPADIPDAPQQTIQAAPAPANIPDAPPLDMPQQDAQAPAAVIPDAPQQNAPAVAAAAPAPITPQQDLLSVIRAGVQLRNHPAAPLAEQPPVSGTEDVLKQGLQQRQAVLYVPADAEEDDEENDQDFAVGYVPPVYHNQPKAAPAASQEVPSVASTFGVLDAIVLDGQRGVVPPDALTSAAATASRISAKNASVIEEYAAEEWI